jgi:Trpc4-associated protein
MFKESRLQACQLIESILLHMPMLNLNRINNIKLILESIDDDGLSCMCKIFAVTLSNLDMNEKKYLANSQKRIQQQIQIQKQNANTPSVLTPGATTSAKCGESKASSSTNQATHSPLSVRDQNQDLLLNIPTLLSRLVNLVRRKDYAVRFAGANSEIEHWIRYIDQTLSDSDDHDVDLSVNGFNNSSDENFYFDLNSIVNNSNTNGSNEANRNTFDSSFYQPALMAAAKLNNFVYVLYTLSLLLIGKEKKKVQRSLTKLRLASALNSLFDYLIWNCRCEYPNSSSSNNNGSNQDQQQQLPPQQQQMRSHICPEVAVKIQFLRLVHSFCDHSE